MAIAFDFFRDAGNFQRQCMLAGGECSHDFSDAGFVFFNQRTFHAAFFGVTEHIEQPAAQKPQTRQQFEAGQHGRAKFLFDQFTLVILFGNQRRCQVVIECEVAFKLVSNALQKQRVGV